MKITADSLKTGATSDEIKEPDHKKTKKGKFRNKKKQDEDVTKTSDIKEVDDTSEEEDAKETSPKQTVLILVCIALLVGIVGGGTYMVLDGLSMNDTDTPSETKPLSEEDQALLDKNDTSKVSESTKKTEPKTEKVAKTDDEIEVETPEDSANDAERIVKLQGEIDRLKSELTAAQNEASAAKESTNTVVNVSASETPAVDENQTIKDLKKQITDLQSSLSASEARESYLQNQLNAAKTDNSK